MHTIQRLRAKKHQFEASLGYGIGYRTTWARLRPYLKRPINRSHKNFGIVLLFKMNITILRASLPEALGLISAVQSGRALWYPSN